ncbi:ABC transporter ATP-binding protein [Gordonia sp. NPDC058843]|uniref:ABC transporter ATP-binding protein n=1 Tax=Gordonia sp. NPDC058843 TaxID=3346648 RepID=UPI00369CC8C6
MKNSPPLRPMEFASVAIFGGLTVAAVVIASVIPLAQAAGLLAPVPLALVAARTRPRALITATVATTAVAFAMAGTGAMATVLGSALIGGLVGDIKRRGRGIGVLGGATLVASPLLGGISVLVLLVLVPLRELTIEAMTNSIHGVAKWLHGWGPTGGVADGLDAMSRSIADDWWVWVWVSGTVGTAISLLVAWWILGSVISRLRDVPSEDTLDAAPSTFATGAPAGDPGIAPLPLVLERVGFAYAPDARPVLHEIDLRIDPGEFVAVVGANGSGKSTLAKILAGRDATTGTVHRPGRAGLGAHGGTALVLQRPEIQMLGSRVADDVVWGLPPGVDVDVDALLDEVGLAGLGDRETTDLSGGQQQRLAIAGALARSPQLLIADEVTSMVDPEGRGQLLALLAGLPARRGIAVVLVTHRGSEAAAADRVIHLGGGRMVPHAPDWMPSPDADLAAPAQTSRPSPPPASTSRIGGPLLVLDQVGYAHLPGSPWEVVALQAISLTVYRGEGLLVVGGNGSGKTTLAWIMAGLLTPGTGTCRLLDVHEKITPGAGFDAGTPMTDRVGAVGLGFQHARLQLQKVTVADEIMAAGGEKVGTAEVARVLELVGLPRQMAVTKVDALSGGQMRRVVLAGLIARHPDLLVLDEPLAGLDPPAREEIVALLARLRADGMTIVIISHDFEALESVCTRRVRLVDGRLLPDSQHMIDQAPGWNGGTR